MILQNSIEHSPMLKNIKGVRIMKLIKLLKMLKLTKAFSFMNMSALWNTEYGKELLQ